MAQEVKLFGMWASPFSSGVQLALKLKGIEYEYIEEDLDNKSPLLLSYNPVDKKVPVLIHNDKPIAQFLVILDYIDETWKDHPLLPADPYDRAKAHFWAKSIDKKLYQIGGKALFGEGNRNKEGIAEFHEFVKLLDKELEGKDFFAGDAIGYLDIAAITVPFLFGRAQEIAGVELLSEEKYPNIFKWTEKIFNMDVINQCYPPKERHVDYMKARIEASRQAST